jgi:molecular chaperone DnaK (HSP70)
MRLGIDFGTTHTVVTLCDRGNYPVLCFLDAQGESHDWFPSVLAVRGEEARYGFDALAVAEDPQWTLLRSFKRLLSGASLGRAVELAGTERPIEELVTGFLRALHAALRERSNLPRRLRDDPRIEAVIGVPANAPGTQRLITLDAFRAAGFQVLAVINEPSAAGFEYTHRYRGTLSSCRDHVIVYDLGGGTFDASLLLMRERHHEVVLTAGLNHLGGDDFDEVLLGMVLEAAGLGERDLPPAARASLRELCREAKEALSPQSRRISIDLEACKGPDAPLKQVSVGAAEFYAACEPLIASSIEAMAPLLGRLDEAEAVPENPEAAEVPAVPAVGAVGDAAGGSGLREDLAGIYVVGGASALPGVGRALRARFGRRVHRSPYPFASTAIGLAIAADEEAGFSLTDLFSRCFGVFREAQAGREAAFDPIFRADTALKAAPRLCRSYRAAHNIGHFRFVECSRLDGTGSPQGDLTPVGEARFPFDPQLEGRRDLASVPVQRTGEGPLIEEEYSIDPHGIVHVTIRNVDGGYAHSYEIGRTGAAP